MLQKKIGVLSVYFVNLNGYLFASCESISVLCLDAGTRVDNGMDSAYCSLV